MYKRLFMLAAAAGFLIAATPQAEVRAAAAKAPLLQTETSGIIQVRERRHYRHSRHFHRPRHVHRHYHHRRFHRSHRPWYGYRPSYGYYGYYGPSVGVYFGAPWYWSAPYYGYAYPYAWGYPAYRYVPPLAADPPAYVEKPADAPAGGAWYYCEDPQGYFPHVARCNRPWIEVAPSEIERPPEGGAP